MENFHGRIPFSLSTSLIPLHYCKVLLFGLYKDKDCLLNKLTTPRSVVEDVMPIIWRKLKCSICKNCLKRQVEENLLIYQGHDIYHDHENPHLIFMSIKLITFPQSFDRVLLYTGIRQALDKGVALSGSLQVIYCQAVTVQTIILVKKWLPIFCSNDNCWQIERKKTKNDIYESGRDKEWQWTALASPCNVFLHHKGVVDPQLTYAWFTSGVWQGAEMRRWRPWKNCTFA